MSPTIVAGLRAAMRGRVFGPSDPGFADATKIFNTRFDDVIPNAVVRPVDGVDVRDAIRLATSQGVAIRSRSGGHSYAGYSTISNGVVLDLRDINAVQFNAANATAAVGAGAQLIDVYNALAQHGRTIPGGSCPSVGIAGVTLGGGFGLASRYFGLTLDSLVGVRIVTADGALKNVNGSSDPDLFWALRGGGGGNFGVVSEFVFKTHPMPATSTFFNVEWPWSSANEAIAAWQTWAPHAVDTITSILHVDAPGHISADGQYMGPSPDVPGLLHSLLAVPGAELTANVTKPYLQTQLLLAGCDTRTVAQCHTAGAAPGGTMPREAFNAKSDYVSVALPEQGRAAMIAAAEAPGAGALLCDSYGGAVGRIDPQATAFVHRNPLFCIQYYGDGATGSWIGQAAAKMRPYVSGSAYQNYIDPTLTNWEHAYYGQNLPRLENIRTRVDPHHYFNFPQAIGR